MHLLPKFEALRGQLLHRTPFLTIDAALAKLIAAETCLQVLSSSISAMLIVLAARDPTTSLPALVSTSSHLYLPILLEVIVLDKTSGAFDVVIVIFGPTWFDVNQKKNGEISMHEYFRMSFLYSLLNMILCHNFHVCASTK